jgi:hypothetical protein
MCIIIDANCAADFANAAPEAAPIAKWLLSSSSKIAIGGTKLKAEYSKVKRLTKVSLTLQSRGQIYIRDADVVDQKEQHIKAVIHHASDDEHILALAMISGARLVYSHDKALHQDFCDPHILSPRGRVYQNADHVHLLNRPIQCNTP